MKVGATLQVVSFEIGVACNLATLHPQCPVALGMARYGQLDTSQRMEEETVVATMLALYGAFDFRGWFNFSYYNEPMLQLPTLLRLAQAAAEVAPDCPRMVITNGTLLPADLEPLRIFTVVHVTDYGGAHRIPTERLEALSRVTTVQVNPGKLDGRMRGPGPDRSDRGCLYPFSDLTIDQFGHVRLCCFDWQGLGSPGNLFRDGLAGCLARWETSVRALAQSPMAADAPTVCRTCRHSRFQTLARTHLGARQAAKAWLKESA